MIEIIPAIDIIDGSAVRLEQGDFERRKTYTTIPVEVAKRFEDVGFRRLHIVDLDGARRGRVANLDVLESIASTTSLAIDFSGGIKSDEDIAAVFEAGAAFASIGSVAVKSPDVLRRWIAFYGGEKLLLGADVRDRRIAIDGWQTTTELDVFDFLSEWTNAGITASFVTDIAKDGLLEGSSDELYADIVREIPELKLIASGGVACVADIESLDRIGCAGVIIGKAFYEGRIDVEECGRRFGF